MKKAELSMNMIIIIALGLLILIVVAFVFMNNINNQNKGTSCIKVGGVCQEGCDIGVTPLTADCPDGSRTACCPIINPNP